MRSFKIEDSPDHRVAFLFPKLSFEVSLLGTHKLVATDLSKRLAGKSGKTLSKVESGFLTLD